MHKRSKQTTIPQERRNQTAQRCNIRLHQGDQTVHSGEWLQTTILQSDQMYELRSRTQPALRQVTSKTRQHQPRTTDMQGGHRTEATGQTRRTRSCSTSRHTTNRRDDFKPEQ
eukprot:5384760-Amphidinium_carterae.1